MGLNRVLPGNLRVKHAFSRKKPGKWGGNRGFHLILLDVFGIIVEYDHQETR